MPNAIEQAENHLSLHERKTLSEMTQWMKDSRHRAESCGCLNCKKEADSAYEALKVELGRVRGPQTVLAVPMRDNI